MNTYEELLAELPSRESINIKWWVVLESGKRMRHSNTMRVRWWGFEATCACGWDSKTGGALRSAVRQDVSDHKFYDHQ